MDKKKVLFLGSKPIGYYCFEHLINNADKYNIEIVGLLSNDNRRFNPELSLIDLARENDIEFIDSLEKILEMDFDFLISIQYHQILKQHHIDKARDLAINLHMAPLPEYRGCNQFSFAIYNQAHEFGTTIHRLEAGIDSGDIIAERRFDIPDNCLVSELFDLTYEASLELFRSEIERILKGDYELIPQERYHESRGTAIYYRKDIEKLKKIDLNDGEDDIARRIRATAMPGFEPPYFENNGMKFYITPDKLEKLKEK